MTRAARRRLLLVCGLAAAALGCVVDYQVGSEPRTIVAGTPSERGTPEAETTVRVAADQAWTDSGVDVRAGDRLQIDYLRGRWSPWPGGAFDAIGSGGDPRCDCNRMAGVSHAALIGRIGDGEPFFVGGHWLQGAGASGRLYLGINDTRLSDNSGWLEVGVLTGD